MKKAKDIKKVTVMGWGAYRIGDTVGGGKVASIEAHIDPALVVTLKDAKTHALMQFVGVPFALEF
jgi:hypothetical protein